MKTKVNPVGYFKALANKNRRTYTTVLEPHEAIVLQRYVNETGNPQIRDVPTLLTALLEQQVEFIIEALAESDLVVTKLFPDVCGDGKAG